MDVLGCSTVVNMCVFEREREKFLELQGSAGKIQEEATLCYRISKKEGA